MNPEASYEARKAAYQVEADIKIESLRSQLTQLQAEAIELAAMVERLRDVLASIDHGKRCCPDSLPCHICKKVRATLESQSPPTGFGSRMLELAKMAVKYEKAWEARKYESDGTENTLWWQLNMEKTAGELLKLVRAITKQDSLFIGGE